MKLTFAGDRLAQPSQVTSTASPSAICGSIGSADEEAHLDVAGRQDRDHRPAGRHQFRRAGNRSAARRRPPGEMTLRRASLVSAEVLPRLRGRQRLTRSRDVLLARRQPCDRHLAANFIKRRLVAVEICRRGVQRCLRADGRAVKLLLAFQLGGRELQHRPRRASPAPPSRRSLHALLRELRAALAVRAPRRPRGGRVHVGPLQSGSSVNSGAPAAT